MNRRTFMKSVGVVAAAMGIGATVKASDIETDSPEREMQGIFCVEGSDTVDFVEPKSIGKKYVELVGDVGVYGAGRRQEYYAKFWIRKTPKYRYMRILGAASCIKCFLIKDNLNSPIYFDSVHALMVNEDVMDFGA